MNQSGSAPLLGSTRFRSLSDPESLREFARNIREGIYITTRDGEVLDANHAFLEIAGVASLSELGHGGAIALYADPERRKEQVRLLEADGSVREFEIAIRRPDGADPNGSRQLQPRPRPGYGRRVHSRNPHRHHGAEGARGVAARDEHARRAHRRPQPSVSRRDRRRARRAIPPPSAAACSSTSIISSSTTTSGGIEKATKCSAAWRVFSCATFAPRRR